MANANQPIVGGLYASRDEDGRYRICKVLLAEELAVHIRTYATRFDELPTGIRSSQLSMGGVGLPEGFGMGHMPIAHQGFWLDDPVLVGTEPVDDDELLGYRIWAGLETFE
jgi:hypothetical protein